MTTQQKPSILEQTVEVETVGYRLAAQGDSWFDYPGHDIIDFLRISHGQDIDNISISRSTLEDIAGASENGVPQVEDADEVKSVYENDRMGALINLIDESRGSLHGVLLSAGGNDLAGSEFTKLIDDALLEMEDPGRHVSQSIMFVNLRRSYRKIFRQVVRKGRSMGVRLHIFIHGYDYPWPDGRGTKEQGPWFHEAFNSKNFRYENNSIEQLQARRAIVRVLIDNLNEMLKRLAQEPEFAGLVHHVDLRNTLMGRFDWANELHPTEEGFKKLANKFNYEIQRVLFYECLRREYSFKFVGAARSSHNGLRGLSKTSSSAV